MSTLRDRWIKRLKQEEKAHADFRRDAESAQRAYYAETARETNNTFTYPLFWSTVKVLHGRIYAQPPKPDVRKRYPDQSGTSDPSFVGAQPAQGQPAPLGQPPQGAGAPGMGGNGMPPSPVQGGMQGPGAPPQPPQPPPVDDNKIAQAMERALSYTIDTTEFDSDGHMAVNDLLVAGLGIAKVEMQTDTESQPVLNPMTGEPIMLDDETGQPFDPMIHTGEPIPAMQDTVVDQVCNLVAFGWNQFRWEPQQHWNNVTWVAFDHWLTADQIKDKWDVDLSKNGIGGTGGMKTPNKPDSNMYKEQYCVHEIWDKDKKQRIFICEELEEELQSEEDPLGLKDFFPCPKPMMLNVKDDDLVPAPDYKYCAPMFKECTRLTDRIMSLTRQIKDVGFYDASFSTELQDINKLEDGALKPIANLQARLEALKPGSSGYDSVVMMRDNTGKVSVVQELIQLREQTKQNIWEIYGVSDIQRGSTDPNETATAQSIKAQWGDIRVGERIRIVALFFRDVFRIMSEIMAEKFQPDILEKMTGIQLTDAELQVLKSDYGRCYAIDVESDSTVVQDEYAEKQNRLEFLTTVTGYLQQILPGIQHGLIPADLGKELMLFAVNTFKNGRQLEQAINSAPGTIQQISQFQQTAQQAQQQVQQLQKQLQDTQKQLQQVNAGKEQRENIKTATDAQSKQVSDQKTAAETTRTELETAQIAQGIHEQASSPIKGPPIDKTLAGHVASPGHFQ